MLIDATAQQGCKRGAKGETLDWQQRRCRERAATSERRGRIRCCTRPRCIPSFRSSSWLLVVLLSSLCLILDLLSHRLDFALHGAEQRAEEETVHHCSAAGLRSEAPHQESDLGEEVESKHTRYSRTNQQQRSDHMMIYDEQLRARAAVPHPSSAERVVCGETASKKTACR